MNEIETECLTIHYFLYIVCQEIVSDDKRFEKYNAYKEIFGFLFTVRLRSLSFLDSRLRSLSNESLKVSCIYKSLKLI